MSDLTERVRNDLAPEMTYHGTIRRNDLLALCTEAEANERTIAELRERVRMVEGILLEDSETTVGSLVALRALLAELRDENELQRRERKRERERNAVAERTITELRERLEAAEALCADALSVIESAKPKEWEPYDAWGDFVEADSTNSGDVFSTGTDYGHKWAADRMREHAAAYQRIKTEAPE